ncbi:MAG: methyltransferase domain-containing protein [Caldilineaceae bacterium]
MATSAAKFDAHIEQWRQEQAAPWHKLKYRQTAANLAKHLPNQKLHILDAGGGNGFDALPLAQQGHQVAIVDYSQEMLADARQRIKATNLEAQIQLYHADVQEISHLFPNPIFDVVLCHNVLQYVGDIPALLRHLMTPLRKGGLLSLIGVNRFARVYMAAFLRNDLVDAMAQIDARTVQGVVFDTPLTNYSVSEIAAMVAASDCQIEQDYGLLCVTSYWGDNERKSDPAIYAQLEQLELALTDKHPYKLLASYYQIIAQKVTTLPAARLA